MKALIISDVLEPGSLIRLLVPAVLAGVLSFALTPVARWLSVQFGAIDHPDPRKVHGVPMPRLGGLAVLTAVFAVIAPACFGTGNSLLRLPRELALGVALGVIPVVCISIVDDVRDVRPVWRVLAQLAGAGIAVHQGIVLNPQIHLFGREIEIGFLAIPLSILWLVGVTNAFNLVDGLDGLSAGLALISAAGLGAIFILCGQRENAAMAMVLAGALVGFLPFNVHPASIFLGETGAASIGFILACLGLKGGATLSAGFAVLLPVLALGLPVAEAVISVARRLLRSVGRPVSGVFDADREHIHHRLLDLGLSHRNAVLVLYGVGALLTFGSLASIFATQRQAGLLLSTLLLAAFIGIKRLGYDEFAFLRKGTMLKLYDAPVVHRGLFAVFVDVVLVAGSLYVARGLKTDAWAPAFHSPETVTVVGVVSLVSISFFWAFGLYRGSWRVASLDEFVRCAVAVGTSSGVAFSILSAFDETETTFSHVVIFTLVALSLVCGSRLLYRLLQDEVWKASALGKPVLIYGAGLGGLAAVRELMRNPTWGMRPVGFLDDDPKLLGRFVSGLPVVGSVDTAGHSVEQLGAKSIVISTEKIPDERVDHLRAIVKTFGVRVYRFDIRFDRLDAWRAERERKVGASPP